LRIDLDRNLTITQKRLAYIKRLEGCGRKRRRQELYHRIFTAVIYTHRPVVLQFDLHHRLEDPVLHPFGLVRVAQPLNEIIIQFARGLRVGGFMEVRLVALFQMAVECKLGYWIVRSC
jgi:hypothetical protein